MTGTRFTSTGKIINLPKAKEVGLYTFKIGTMQYSNRSSQDTMDIMKKYINSLEIKLNGAMTWHKELIDIKASGYAVILSDWLSNADIPPYGIWNVVQSQIQILKKLNKSPENIPALMIMINYTSNEYDKLYNILAKYADRNQRGYSMAIEKLEFVRDTSKTIIGAYNPYVGAVYGGAINLATQASEVHYNLKAKIDGWGIVWEVAIDEIFAAITDKIAAKAIEAMKLPAVQKSLPFDVKEHVLNFLRLAPNVMKEKLVKLIINKTGDIIADMLKSTLLFYRNIPTELTGESLANTITDKLTKKEAMQSFIGNIAEDLMKK